MVFARIKLGVIPTYTQKNKYCVVTDRDDTEGVLYTFKLRFLFLSNRLTFCKILCFLAESQMRRSLSYLSCKYKATASGGLA